MDGMSENAATAGQCPVAHGGSRGRTQELAAGQSGLVAGVAEPQHTLSAAFAAGEPDGQSEFDYAEAFKTLDLERRHQGPARLS